jgi:kynurenine formamidase
MSDATAGRFADLSHAVEHGMITYPGLPAPAISEFLSRQESRAHYSPGTEFHIGRIEMVANTGTYLDAPFHRYPDGPDLSQLPLDSMADLEGVVIRAPTRSERAIGAERFDGFDLAGKAVLIDTGWSAHWGTERYLSGHPYLTEGAARRLVAARAALVGIDSLNIDDTDDGRRPAHSLLLRAGIPIVEHLTGLNQLPDRGFRFFAVPVKVKGLGSFPVRACALI